MKIALVFFLALNLFSAAASFFTGGISLHYQLVVVAILVSSVGIPHGAIDHILFLHNKKSSTLKFYVLYFSLMLAVILLWAFMPMGGLISFLALSAYHFGQSQLAQYTRIRKPIRVTLYITWGLAIISGLCAFNQLEILDLISLDEDLLQIKPLFDGFLFYYLLAIFSILFVFILLFFNKTLGYQTVLFELGIFTLIQISFIVNPVLLGFSIYFASLHSLHVLQQEFKFFRQSTKAFNWYNFTSLLVPYTLLSLLGLILLLALSHFDIVAVSKTLLVFAAISALTLPHSIVMERFYNHFNT